MPVTTPLPPIDFAALRFNYFELLDQTFKRLESGLPVVEIALDSPERATEVEERFNYLAVRRNLPICFELEPVRDGIYRISHHIDESELAY
ncbi:hypothetical protein CLV58_101185 [Spirosoma oryzae]|uniref:Uncharacterized protein n=1 Tax=Spirosoma oryzae TaxID=1469603 RepID=A0A2T0TNC2_9BACT|nr:hypothetical protein [Spirosoma oryzae]PRY47119.1 hypothetical protein CLV58_101185 [Spirosoma oryzae]